MVEESRHYSVLIVDDEPDISELVAFNIKNSGFDAKIAGSGEQAIKDVRSASPDLIVLDLMLPGIDGLDVCRLLKSDPETSSIPIIMLTARGEENDIVKGLELGADDYITKPFSPQILIARIKSVMRRHQSTVQNENERIVFQNIVIDPEKYRAQVSGEVIDLTHTEFEILHLLLRHPGRVYTRNEIVDNVHGYDYPVTDRSVDVQIVGLRKKLGNAAKYIETVRGVGYRCREL
ncbi:response regulator [bacterium]|nr:response regulator [bacterium]